mgnify:FL=1
MKLAPPYGRADQSSPYRSSTLSRCSRSSNVPPRGLGSRDRSSGYAPVITSAYIAIDSAGSRSTDSTAIAADFFFATDVGDPATQSVMGSPAPRASVNPICDWKISC